MSAIAGFDMGLALAKHKMCTALHKFFTDEEIETFYKTHKNQIDYVWLSIGKDEKRLMSLKSIFNNLGIQPNIVVDVPNGHLEMFVNFCQKVRNTFDQSIIMGGNVCTSEMTGELLIHGGLDIVKTNIGTGNLCLSRVQTGIGYGSAATTIECSSTAHGLKSNERQLGLICSDGGMRHPGDFAKNFALGADFLMAGSFFAGLEENCGEWEYNIAYDPPRKSKLKFYGMSSKEAQEKHYGEYKLYRASEGRSESINYRGKVDDIVQDLLGSLRSTATYIGARSLKDFSKCAVFAKVNQIHPRMEEK
jgi:GMP reductase